jgi:hypothetical protein
MIVAFTAPLKRIRGHKGPDNLTFRIIGLNNLWVTGAGRTGQIAGQTNLFSSKPGKRDGSPEGSIESRSFKAWKERAIFYSSAEGSCMRVKTISGKYRWNSGKIIQPL